MFGGLEDLEYYINKCFHQKVMGKPNKTPTSCSKRNGPENSPRANYSLGVIMSNIFLSINQKLSSLDNGLNLVQAYQPQVVILAVENQAVRKSLKPLHNVMTQL